MARRFFQFAFDFFSDPLRPALPLPLSPKTPVKVQKTGFPHAEQGFDATKNVAEALGTSPHTAPYAFRHPAATRETLLGSHQVAYLLQRSKRRTIGFVISAQGLAVRAPGWVPLREIDRAVQSKSGWILGKLQASRTRAEQAQAQRCDWRAGGAIDYLGAPVTLVLAGPQAGRGKPVRRAQGPLHQLVTSAAAAPELQLALPQDAGEDQIEQAAQAWLRHQALLRFTDRLAHFAPRLGVAWRSLALSNARTRWGSASSSGAIRLNWRLLHLPPELIDYVVVHELAHLRHMDHSPRFWAIVAEVLPHHAALRRQLRQTVLSFL